MSSVDSVSGGAVPAGGSRAAASPNYITWAALALMTVSSVASLRPAPTMAVYGLACVFLYVLPAIVFLIPTALVSAELASGWSGGQLKVTQEVITLTVFGIFMVTVLGEPLGWRHLGAFLCLVGAVAFLFAGK